MLDLKKLNAVTTIITHRNASIPCPDGVASALILRSALSGLEIRFLTHDAELLHLPATPGMLFCDIAPPAHRVAEFLDAGALVLDHHRTARGVVESFGKDGVFADEKEKPGVSGAWLAFQEVWLPLRGQLRERPEVEKVARLAGIRDTWQRASIEWREACEQAEALTFWPWSAWPIDFVGNSYATMRLWDIGPVLLEKKEARTRELRASGIRMNTTEKGTRVLIVPTTETSDVAELEGTESDIVVGFRYGKTDRRELPLLIVSTRSHAGFDCASLSRAYGGGGHTKAAGFSVELDEDAVQPFEMIMNLLERFESGLP